MNTSRLAPLVGSPVFTALVAAVAISSLACGGGGGEPSGPPEPAALRLDSAVTAPAVSGEPLAAAVIQLVDRSGQPLERSGVRISVALGELQGELIGTTTESTDASGRASFPGLRLSGPVGTYHLVFSSPGLTGTRSTIVLAAGAPALLRAVSVQHQYAPAWTAVRVLPRVRVTDAGGNPVAGVPVFFSPGPGGSGSGLGASITGADGEAAAYSWVLGGLGDHALEARATGLGLPVAFSATALPAQGMFRITQQPPGAVSVWEILKPPPQVQLYDAYGAPSTATGVPVSVQVGGGPGGIAGNVVQVTDAGGRATFSGISFTGESAGTRTLVFTGDQRAAAESAPVNVGQGAASAYGITLRYVTGVSPGQAAAFEWARARISRMIVGDVTDIFVNHAAIPECGNVPLSELVDDLLIWVEVRPIDGVGGILGQAGPCLIRSASKLPVVGIMFFDLADLGQLEGSGRLDSVILHEMLHVVGFGSAWQDLGLLAGAGTSDPYFTGQGARGAFAGFDGASYPGPAVPVENTGAAGTRDSHWRETVMRDELMTGWISGPAQPLSRTTIASLGDLGYVVDLSWAEPLAAAQALRAGPEPGDLDLGGDVLPIPAREVPER